MSNDRGRGFCLAVFLVSVAALWVLGVTAAFADDVVSWQITSGSVSCGVNDLSGTAPAATPALELSAAADRCTAGEAYYGNAGSSVGTVIATSFAGGTYSGSGTVVFTPAAGAPLTSSVVLFGTCSAACVGPGGGSSTPAGSIPLDGSQVGFWVVVVGSSLMFALGFIGGRMR